jgi:hypothetical protein
MDLFSICNDAFDQVSNACPSWYEEHYDQFPGLDDDLAELYDETCVTLGSTLLLEDRLLKDKGRELHVIQSNCGDDEHHTTDSYSWGPAIIGFGPMLNGIKLSWKDAGISHIVGNYAEGWIITPPSAEASFESVNRRHVRAGVPFTLDPVKLKLLSPVRKQSSTYDTDLESKISHLAEIASWSDRGWFTYDFHQLALLLAPAIFDFEDARTFPYLYKTEGGSGGTPPYGNLDTMYSGLHYYTRGKSRKAILGLMDESVKIHLGLMKPKDSFFLRASHLCNMGDSGWLKFESAYRKLLSDNSLSRQEADDLLAATEGTTLPSEILAFATEINPESFVEGSVISALRKDGLLLTEIDVKMALDAKKREFAVMGKKPIRILNEEIAEEQAAFKGNHLKVLAHLSDDDPLIKESLKASLYRMPSEPNQEFRDLASAYYKLRSESHSKHTSFHYSDAIRVFKTSEVAAFIERRQNRVREDFSSATSLPTKWVAEFLEETSEERRRKLRVNAWFESAPLAQLLYNPIPEGVGTDDARIAREVLDVAKSTQKERITGLLVFLYSGDKYLARYTMASLKPHVSVPQRMVQIDKSLYLRICLDGVAEFATLKRSGRIKTNGLPVRIPRSPGREVMYYNFLLKTQWWLPSRVVEDAYGPLLRGSYEPRILVHSAWDYPNIERGLDLVRYESKTNTIYEYGGGYLDRRTVRSLEGSCWSQQSWYDIKSWPDFDMSLSKRHFKLHGGLRMDRVFHYDPMSYSSYGENVRRWLDRRPSTRSGPKGPPSDVTIGSNPS